MLHRTIMTLAGTAALGSLLIGTGATAAPSHRQHHRYFVEPLAWSTTGGAQCRVVGAISHHCYNFISDATFPEGIPGNNYGN